MISDDLISNNCFILYPLEKLQKIIGGGDKWVGLGGGGGGSNVFSDQQYQKSEQKVCICLI